MQLWDRGHPGWQLSRWRYNLHLLQARRCLRCRSCWRCCGWLLGRCSTNRDGSIGGGHRRRTGCSQRWRCCTNWCGNCRRVRWRGMLWQDWPCSSCCRCGYDPRRRCPWRRLMVGWSRQRRSHRRCHRQTRRLPRICNHVTKGGKPRVVGEHGIRGNRYVDEWQLLGRCRCCCRSLFDRCCHGCCGCLVDRWADIQTRRGHVRIT